jgi:hypothetical protein
VATWIPANDWLERITEREINADAIAQRLRHIGYDVTTDRVLRHYRDFVEWDQQRLKLGYLRTITGIRRVT